MGSVPVMISGEISDLLEEETQSILCLFLLFVYYNFSKINQFSDLDLHSTVKCTGFCNHYQ